MPQLTLNGVPLLYDLRNEAQQFLDRFQRIEDLIDPPLSTSRDTWQTNPAGGGSGTNGILGEIGLPRYNWPARPPLRVNQLYWPTGATRFAYGMFLIDYQGRTDLLEFDCDQPMTLVAETDTVPAEVVDGRGSAPHRLEISCLYMLTPRRINACNITDGLYLLPVVDRRWWWQFQDLGDIRSQLQSEDSACMRTCSATWNELIAYLAERLGFGFSPADRPAAYQYPDCREFARQFHSAAMALDAAAASIGNRIVAEYNGTYSFEDVQEATQKLALNASEMSGVQTAGFDCLNVTPRHAPAAVRVAYPKVYKYHRFCEEEYYTQDYATSANCTVSGSVKTIHSTALADMGTDCEPASTPANYAELWALTSQIAQDWIAWRNKEYDITFVSPQSWRPNGFDDHILWGFGQEFFDGYEPVTSLADGPADRPTVAVTELNEQFRRDHFTRVQSLPMLCDVDSMFHNIGVTMLPDEVLVKLCDCWQADPCCEDDCWPKAWGTVQWFCGCDYINATGNIELPVHSSIGILPEKFQELKAELCAGNCIPIRTGCCDRAWARWNCEENRWEVEAWYDDLWRFTLEEDLCRGGCAQARLRLACCGQPIADTMVTFEVCDRNSVVCQQTASSTAGPRWVEAVTCILPGQTTGTARVLREDANGQLEIDPDCEEITINNEDCLIVAIPGDRFKVDPPARTSSSSSEGGGGDSGEICIPAGTRGVARFWPDTCEFEVLSLDLCSQSSTSEAGCETLDGARPNGPWFLTRRARVKEMVDCGKVGLATLLRMESADDNCNWSEVVDTDSEAEECEVEFCNTAGRKIGCDADEDVTLFWTPGDCIAWVVPSARPMFMTATLDGAMCGNAAPITGPSFPDVCDWDPRVPPYQILDSALIYGCTGDKVVGYWNDDACEWDVLQVQEHQYEEVMTDILCGENCEIMKKVIKGKISVHQCEDCDEEVVQSALVGEAVEVLVSLDFDCETCETVRVTKEICVFCSGGESSAPEEQRTPMATIDMITGASFECDTTPGSSSSEEVGEFVPTARLVFSRSTACVLGCTPAATEQDTINFTQADAVTDAILTFADGCWVLQTYVTPMFVLCVGEETQESPTTVCGTDCEDSSSGGA